MRRTFLVLIAAALCLSALTGCDKVAGIATPHRKSKVSVAPVPDLEILGVTEEEQIALRDVLVVRGLLQQAADYVVIINTQLVRKGESLQMNVRKQMYNVKVLSVTEMRVVLEASKMPSASPPAK